MADKDQMMDVLRIRPGMFPEQIQIGINLESLQKAVDGFIEVTYPFEDQVAIICDEEGKLTGKEPNRGLYGEDGELYDVVFGDFLVVGLGEDDFTSLDPQMMKKYERVFHRPEAFARINGRVIAIPIPDENVKNATGKVPRTPKHKRNDQER